MPRHSIRDIGQNDGATAGVSEKVFDFIKKYTHLNLTLADQAVVSGVNFLTGILLARALGPKDFGAFTLAWFAVLFVSSLQFALISAPMMSIGPKQPESRAPRYFGAVFAQQATFALVSSLLVLVGASICNVFFPHWQVGILAVPLALATAAHQMRDFVRRYLFTCSRFGTALALDVTCYGLQIGLLGWLAFRERLEVSDPLWIVLISATVGLLGVATRIGKLKLQKRHFYVVLRRHWRFSRWLGASAILQVISSQVFLVVSGLFLGAASVGALRASQNLMGLAQILFFGLQNVIPVRAGMHYRRDGISGLLGYVKRVAGGMELATAAIALTFAVAPEFWLHLIFGDQFAGNGRLVIWFAAIYMVVALSFPLTGGLWALESTRPIFICYAVSTAVSVATAYPLLAYFGVDGAAAGSLLTETVMVGILWVGFYRKVRQVRRQSTSDEARTNQG